MTISPALASACAQLLAANIRVVGFTFDGSGDSGSIDSDLRLFPEPSWSLQCIKTDFVGNPAYDVVGRRDVVWFLTNTNHANERFTSAVLAAFEVLNTMPPAQVRTVENELTELAYSTLEEHFPGDWVNNAGGYGLIAFDLQTGDFHVWGQQRIEDTVDASASGTCAAWPVMTTPLTAPLQASETYLLDAITAALTTPPLHDDDFA